MAKTIAGFYRTRQEGAAAQDALLQRGFTRNEVSFLAGDTSDSDPPAVGPPADLLKGGAAGAESETGRDAWIGGAIGLAAGAIAGAFPPLLVAGPVALAIAGLSAGAAAGGIVGLLKDHGISQEEAEFYAEGVKKGGALVTVRVESGEREKLARKILDEYHPLQKEELQAGRGGA